MSLVLLEKYIIRPGKACHLVRSENPGQTAREKYEDASSAQLGQAGWRQ